MRYLLLLLVLGIFAGCSSDQPEPEPLNELHSFLIGDWQLIEREVFDNTLLTLTENPVELHSFTYDTYTDGEGIEHQYQPEKLTDGDRDTISVEEDLTIIIEHLGGGELQLFKVQPDNLLYWEYYDKAD